jgi:hypothetical protein
LTSFHFVSSSLRLFVSIFLLSGCIGDPQHPAATQPSTFVDPATTQPSYWMAQPPNGVVTSPDFLRLWAICENVARQNFFKLDREDYRSGTLTTQPLVSGQWLEPWRQDNRTFYDVQESSLAAIRRTITFQFTRLDDTTWQVAPKVLIERQAIAEKRITSVVLFNNIFNEPLAVHQQQHGTLESDVGINLPERYWYPLRRDAEYEQYLTRAIQRKLNR